MSQEETAFRRTLKRQGYFVTQPRLRLFELLQKQNALTIKQLITLLPKQDQSTVYRNIKTFEELGIINRLQLGWHSKLELSDTFYHHHHHFTCLKCSAVIKLPDDPALERQISILGRDQQFKAIDHHLEIRGFCPSCQ